MLKYSPNSTPEKPIGQVLTLQGHFEMDSESNGLLVEVRNWEGVITDSELAEARRRVKGTIKAGRDDGEEAGWAVLDFMLQELVRS